MGAQFTSWAFSGLIRNKGLIASMGTISDCYEGAVGDERRKSRSRHLERKDAIRRAMENEDRNIDHRLVGPEIGQPRSHRGGSRGRLHGHLPGRSGNVLSVRVHRALCRGIGPGFGRTPLVDLTGARDTIAGTALPARSLGPGTRRP